MKSTSTPQTLLKEGPNLCRAAYQGKIEGAQASIRGSRGFTASWRERQEAAGEGLTICTKNSSTGSVHRGEGGGTRDSAGERRVSVPKLNCPRMKEGTYLSPKKILCFHGPSCVFHFSINHTNIFKYVTNI